MAGVLTPAAGMTPPMGLLVCCAHSTVPCTAFAMLDESNTSQTKNFVEEPSSEAMDWPSSFMSKMETLPPFLIKSSTHALPRPEALRARRQRLGATEGPSKQRHSPSGHDECAVRNLHGVLDLNV